MSTERAGLARRLGRLREPLPFPLGVPNWPTALERPQEPSRLGVNYDTAWARRYPVRLARAAYTDLVTRPVMAAIARPAISGLEHLDALPGPVIFAANHASHLDGPLIVSALPARWRHKVVTLAAADYFFSSHLMAAYSAFTLNAVPIERVKVSRTSAERAQSLVEAGWNLLIFPEGGRSPDGWGQEHRAGAAWLSARTGRPVVPVYVKGTWRLLPRGAHRVYTGETAVAFGRAIFPGDSRARELVGRLEGAIAELADEAATNWWSARRRAARGETPSLRGPGASAWRRAWALGPSPKDRARRRAPPREKRWPPQGGSGPAPLADGTMA
jgi:1-acyl-sn-glycerol-3-phosphate acyltransferase